VFYLGVPDYVDYDGAPERTINVTIAPTGINAAVFLETLDSAEGKDEVKKLRSGFKDLKVIVGRYVLVDRVKELKF
jgi:trehalose-6-phosphate synthase